MSTKIYNGYKLPKLDHDELICLLRDFGSRVQEIGIGKYHRLFADIAVDQFDTHTVGHLAKPENESERILLFHVQSYIKKFDILVDSLECSLVVVPAFRKHLVLLYATDQDYIRTWEEVEGVSSYGYWNNCDRPDGISSSQWRRRANEWDKALGNDPPSLRGYSFTCILPQHLSPSPELVMQYVPDFSVRVERTVHNILHGELVRSGTLKLDSPSAWRDAWDKWLDSPEGKTAVAELTEATSGQLKKTFSAQELLLEPLSWK